MTYKVSTTGVDYDPSNTFLHHCEVTFRIFSSERLISFILEFKGDTAPSTTNYCQKTAYELGVKQATDALVEYSNDIDIKMHQFSFSSVGTMAFSNATMTEATGQALLVGPQPKPQYAVEASKFVAQVAMIASIVLSLIPCI